MQETGADDVKTDYTLVFTKPDQPVTATVYASLYRQWPVVEWTLWLETRAIQQRRITELNGLDLTVDAADEETEYNLTTFFGSRMNTVAFKPNYQVMEPGKTVSLSGSAGKPSAYWAPYYNLQWQEKGAKWNKAGMLFSVGWSGQWSAKLERTDAGVRMETGQERFASYLEPGERARGPLMSILFYEQILCVRRTFSGGSGAETVMSPSRRPAVAEHDGRQYIGTDRSCPACDNGESGGGYPALEERGVKHNALADGCRLV